MGVHYVPGGINPDTGKRDPHPDLEQYEEAVAAAELEYLRTENKRLNQDNVRLRETVDALSRENLTLRNGMEKDLLVRRLRLDAANYSIRNLQLMARISKMRTGLQELETKLEDYIQQKRREEP